jgi:nickel/cobalt exporter
VGPGHGKVIVTGYLLAGRHTLKQGLILTALALLMQAATAIVLVIGLYKIMAISRQHTETLALYLECMGYALMACVGFILLWRGLREGMRIRHSHVHHAGCNHTLNPTNLHTHTSIRSLSLMVISIGIRPCSGAVLLLVFACLVGAMGAGIGAVLAMAVGTFLTTVLIATLAVSSKQGLLKLFGASEGLLQGVHIVLSSVGGSLIILVAGLFLTATINNLQSSPTAPSHPLLYRP